MAAYRALHHQDGMELYNEQVLGRYNSREILAYTILANLDVREVQNNLQEAGLPLTPTNIFQRQQENINGLISQLGGAQRAYNMDYETGSIDVGVSPVVAGNSVEDARSCAHGYCLRIIDSMQHHSQVNLSDASPASFMREFRYAVEQQVNTLNQAQKQEIENWRNRAEDDQVTVDINNNREINFSTPARNNQIEIPQHFNAILTNVTTEMDTRYNFTDPNPRIQLVKRNDAFDVLRYTHQLPYEFN